MTDLKERALHALAAERNLRGELIIDRFSQYLDGFAAKLSAAVDELVRSGAYESDADVVSAMAERSGWSAGAVKAVLDGQVDQPAVRLVRAMAGVAGLELEDLVDAFVCYYRQLSAIEARKIRQKAKDNEVDAIVYTMIELLEDADGKKIFTLEDKVELKRMPSDLLASIGEQITTRPAVGAAVKN